MCPALPMLGSPPSVWRTFKGTVGSIYDILSGLSEMFFSGRLTKKYVLIVLSAVVVFLLFFLKISVFSSHTQTTAVSDIGVYDLKAETDAERVAFLAQFGWKVVDKPQEISTIVIPQVFNKVYERYNKIQLDQGLDLLNYSGKKCSKVSYIVTNYPDTSQQVNANLLIYNGNVIGGDISSTRLDGFMHGFVLDGFTEEVK